MKTVILLLFVASIVFLHCEAEQPVVEMKHFPITSIDEILTKTGVTIDKEVSSDGNGSLRIEAEEPMTIKLFELTNPDVDNAQVIYQARLKTKDVEGDVYLEMWCGFTGKGEFFSRGLQNSLSGTTDWVTVQTPFFLKKDEKPDWIKLNLVIQGKGTVWIDDVHLLKGPSQ
jgi:hypothetical protein